VHLKEEQTNRANLMKQGKYIWANRIFKIVWIKDMGRSVKRLVQWIYGAWNSGFEFKDCMGMPES
jgi:hypothetical protein